MDPCQDCLAGCLAIYCIGCVQSCATWSLFRPCGAGSGTASSAGCCGSCCKESFDNDELQDELDKERQERLEREGLSTSQPAAKEVMNPAQKRLPEQEAPAGPAQNSTSQDVPHSYS